MLHIFSRAVDFHESQTFGDQSGKEKVAYLVNCFLFFIVVIHFPFAETFVWNHASTSGSPPAKRDSHTCSSWKNKIIIIGGEDSYDYYLSDVHILDAGIQFFFKLLIMIPEIG